MQVDVSRGRPGCVMIALAAAVWSAGCASVPAQSAPVRSAPEQACRVAELSRETALMRIPFEIVHGRVYIQVRVNGRGPYTFAVDTGASGVGRADASLTRELQLPVIGSTQTGDGVNVATVETVRIESLDVGGLIRSNVEVITRDYSRGAPPGAAIAGIVGRDFFDDGLLVIDFPTRTLTFTRTAQLVRANEGVLAYERPFRVPVSIGELTTEANLDTGAAVTLVLPRSFYDQVSAGPLEAAGRGRLTNTVIDTDRTIVQGPVRVGGVSVSNVEARVSDRVPEVLIGGEILQNYVVAIDQRSHLVAVCAPDERSQ